MSLRARLLCLVLLAALLPALLLGWRSVRESQAEVAAAMHALAVDADALAADLEHRVQGTAQLHYGLAHARLLDGADRAACSDYLAQVREAYPQYTGIISVLPGGALHCDSLRSGRVLDLRDRSYYKRVLAGERGLLLEPVFGRLTGNSVLQIVHPAVNEAGALRFMLVASLNLQQFAQKAVRPAAHATPELLLLDAKGTVMAWTGAEGDHPRPGSSIADGPLFRLAQSLPQGGVAEVAVADGPPQVWAVAASPMLQTAGLRVMLGLPKAALDAQPRQRLQGAMIDLATTSLLLCVAVWALAEWGIRRQVGRITTLLRALGGGDLDARIPGPYPRGELGGLMAVLNDTAAALQQQRQDIEDLGWRLREAHGREISERVQSEALLHRSAHYDSLTGLPNRRLFRERLQQALDQAAATGVPFALLFLDLDRFKDINDNLGHDLGDRLLVAVAEVLAGCVGRDGGERLFRVGGDEFTVLADASQGRGPVTALAQCILRGLSRPLQLGEHELYVSASIGIALYGGGNADPESLVKQADMAMYRAKALGRDTYFHFDHTLATEAAERHRLEVRLRHALQRQEFRLHYQPKARMHDDRVTGVEALLRWQPPGEPMIGPDKFIPILEETGLIVEVGAWVLREACSQMMRWKAQGMPDIHLAVNLSARQFRHQSLVADLSQVLAETGFDPARLELELTESMLIDDSQAVLSILAALGGMGISIAIDDFGTGHSSLSYLKRFNLDTLKIDRSFVRHTPGSAEDCAIALAVIALGHGLHLRVVAEGVETPAQREFLAARGCDEYQGYLLSRPLDGAALGAWMAQRIAAEGIEKAETAEPA